MSKLISFLKKKTAFCFVIITLTLATTKLMVHAEPMASNTMNSDSIQVNPPQSNFSLGIQYYNQKDFNQAETLWLQNLKIQPQEPALLFNLALATAAQKKWGLTIAFLRQLQIYFPQDYDLSAIFDYLRQETKNSEVRKNAEHINPMNSFVFTTFTLPETLAIHFGLSFVLLFVFGKHFRNQRRLRFQWQQSGETKGSLPLKRLVNPRAYHWTLVFCWIFLSLHLAFKVAWSIPQRATIISPGLVHLYSAPFEGAPQITSLPEGEFVTVKDMLKDWIQISSPGTPSGWVLKKEVQLHTSEGLL